MLVHHVLFWLKPDITKEQKKAFREGLESLKNVETIKSFHIGVPLAIERAVVDSSYTFSLFAIFDNIEGYNVYQMHSTHLKFLEKFKKLFEKIIIYDSI
ncbi:Stress responsive alpha-beta barrel domain-containing protein [Pseudopedobacter saltans DSM 12145]|uniref:Stress responsive alpha-beta barrel domain-containing protein n=1 Tax=Pseudopedobacter saltans (strain ATCC 51119 / DSM 12145 / JCM 21818 / CCUG 39354 / LMG 10337 / NBRC 100064 / NCIMB 13643) TaxID=762903 RepID=F0S9W6_PSESL|nr:Dabb family protein [Pseudopedobacter saltans]ADY52524.1 Stress responsive alpha-beta barrel domain-containing protein [Pseudopedobacter saltans DSM 12145]